jgi:ABC-type glycerol-3-phosphate transport system permease component
MPRFGAYRGCKADDSVLVAISMCVALPALVVYFALQRSFIVGLTIGAEKG